MTTQSSMLIRSAVSGIAAIVALAGMPAGAAEPSASEICGCNKAAMLQAMIDQGLQIGEGTPGPTTREASNDTDLISIDLDIEVIPTSTTAGNIAGSNTMTVRSLVNGLTQFTFRLRSNFTVTAVTLNGSTPASASAPGANSYGRTVTLDRAYNANEQFTVRVDFNGPAVSRGLGSISFSTQGGNTLVSSLSEPYYAATWMPMKDGDVFLPGDNADKCVGSVAVTAPSALKSVANGLLTSVTPVAGGKTKYRWTTNIPTAPYLFFFSTTNYTQWTQNYNYPLEGGGTGTMPVHFSIFPGMDTPSNRAAWETCLTMLATYRTIYGEYPFVSEKYGIYQFPFGGGMEHQTYTGQGPNNSIAFDEGITSHELGHQWWGDNVTCKTWNDIWLNEGFATYTEALWEERKPGSSGFAALRAAMNASRPSAFNDSVYCYDVTDPNRIFSGNFSYNKAAWVLHQIRHVVGDTTFFAILAQHRAAHQGSAATTNDFRSTCSTVSGIDFTDYFQQWVYGMGVPTYTFGWQNTTVNGQTYLKLVINQTQNTLYGFNSKFDSPIDIRVTTSSGTQNFVVSDTARTQHFLLPLAAPASSVALDPDDWILIESKTSTTYSNGPAKVIGVSPSIGATLSSAPTAINVTFSEAVNANAAAFTINGPSGVVPFSYSYNAGTLTATLTPVSSLASGSYTVIVAPSVTTTASGLALDGEIVGGVLPSGDGIAGGTSTYSFAVSLPVACPADLDNGSGLGTPDNGVDINDLLFFLAKFELGSLDADLDNGSGLGTPDGGVDISDLLFFLAHFESGC